MADRKIILASQSPRRRQLLEQIGLQNFKIQASEYEEDMTLQKEPVELAEFLSLQKVRDVARHYNEEIIIGGDSIVFLGNKVYGKAKNKKEAIKMLQLFSGKKISCVSGLAIIDTKSKKEIVTHDVAWLQFRKLSLAEIKQYVEVENDILGVAGGFNMLSKGVLLFNSIEGDFYSAIGLPMTKLYLELKKMGVDVLKNNK